MLEITTLGGLSIQRDGEPVTEFATRKVEALLIYLACTGRTHAREVLAELFWEERPPGRGRGNLRVALTSLRKHVGEDLIITRNTVTLNPEADVWLDVTELQENFHAGQVEEAMALYRGDFLAGFHVRGCPGFEDWLTLERERLRRQVLDALRDLIGQNLEVGKYRAGIAQAVRLLEINPLLEETHRQLMRLLAYDGQRGAALAQYTACRRVLEELYKDRIEEVAVQLARHYAGDPERERHYARLAGEQAASQSANTEAIYHFSRALELPPETDYVARYELLLAREKVYDLLGAREAQVRDLASLNELANDLDDDARRAVVALRQANYGVVTGDFQEAIEAAQEAIRLSKAVHDLGSEATGLLEWGRTLLLLGDAEAARPQLEQALLVAGTGDCLQLEADTLPNLGNVHWWQRDDEDIRRSFLENVPAHRQILCEWAQLGQQV
jgi:DNA-binding SARP family transcriptional activator